MTYTAVFPMIDDLLWHVSSSLCTAGVRVLGRGFLLRWAYNTLWTSLIHTNKCTLLIWKLTSHATASITIKRWPCSDSLLLLRSTSMTLLYRRSFSFSTTLLHLRFALLRFDSPRWNSIRWHFPSLLCLDLSADDYHHSYIETKNETTNQFNRIYLIHINEFTNNTLHWLIVYALTCLLSTFPNIFDIILLWCTNI